MQEVEALEVAPALAPAPAPRAPRPRGPRRVLRDTLQGISKGDLRRLARRGGVRRMSVLCFEETRGVLRHFIMNVLTDASIYAHHARVKTITAEHIKLALARQGRVLYW